MSAIINRVLDKLSPKEPSDFTVVISGEPSSGKTTLLYLLKLGKVVPTISSIGLNVEAVNTATTGGKRLKLTMWDFGRGCAPPSTDGYDGWPSFRTIDFMASYLAKTDALIWVVDASQSGLGSLTESARSLSSMLDIIEPWQPGRTKNDYPVLILANKQDRPDKIPLYQIREAFEEAVSGRRASIFPTSLTNPINTSGLPEAFDWYCSALENAARQRIAPEIEAILHDLEHETFYTRDTLYTKEHLQSWVLRAEADNSLDHFISQFRSLSLPSWDHYTWIGITFSLLITYGYQKGKDMIFEGMEKYITEGRGHMFYARVTVTYFWIQVVYLGIRNMLPSNDLDTDEMILPSNITGMTPSEQFALFLILNPFVFSGNLWGEYYSAEAIMSPAAQRGILLPDKMPLPTLVVALDATSK